VSGLCLEAELATTRGAVTTTRDGVQASFICPQPTQPVQKSVKSSKGGWKHQRSDPLWLGTSWSTQPPPSPPEPTWKGLETPAVRSPLTWRLLVYSTTQRAPQRTGKWNHTAVELIWWSDQSLLNKEVSNHELKRDLKIQPPNFNTCSAETSIEVWKLAYRRTETRKRNGGNKKRTSFVDELADTWCNGKSRG
jgi:hypothetical protein